MVGESQRNMLIASMILDLHSMLGSWFVQSQMPSVQLLTSYERYLNVPPISSSCSKTIGSNGKLVETASSKDLQVTSPEGPAPTTTTLIATVDKKRQSRSGQGCLHM